ncbi:RcgR family putative quorum lactone hydrolase [Agrobacterium vitis]|uniref:RcgR family putative quorum lactone hydrolase n=1 Tax=Agrobacterium vitis TaxID=373 RepID=UPI001F1B425F|nr:dienelactone hydrolase family protein [Agrobacterium vitis]
MVGFSIVSKGRKGEKMFRYLARVYDRKNMLKSLERQKRISQMAIPFSQDGIDDVVFSDMSKVEEFFAPISPAEPISEGPNTISFQSDILTDDKNNNAFDCVVTDSLSKDHALVVFHHWYARNRYPAFAKYFAKKGITVIQATLPHHFGRATNDYSEEKFFNADLGCTVQSMRQAVLDGRKIVRWLYSQGYKKISVVGMCLGGTVAGLVAAQEQKVDKAVLMVSPGSPADLVWTGETMRALRGRIEPSISLEGLRTAWGVIDLEQNLWHLSRPSLDLMLLLGKDDTIARSDSSERVIEFLKKVNLPPTVVRLNCGHSSIGMFPYNLIAARKVMRFLKETPTLSELWEIRGFRYNFSEVFDRSSSDRG